MSREWGVKHAATDTLWRGPMGEDEALEFVKEWEADGGREGTFVVVSRETGPWVEA